MTASVKDGKVNITHANTTGNNSLDEDKTVVVSDSVEMREVSPDEMDKHAKLKPVNFIPDIEKRSDVELNETGNPYF